MASNIDERARQGSGPGLTALKGMAGTLERLARMAGAARGQAGERGVSPGGALRAEGRPEGSAPCLACGADVPVYALDPRQGPPSYCGRCAERQTAREVCTARLSAAADDAEELAAGLGLDAASAIRTACCMPTDAETQGKHAALLAGFELRAGRLARVAVRLALQSAALRAVADAVQEADGELPADLCFVCGELPVESEHGALCVRCWMATR